MIYGKDNVLDISKIKGIYGFCETNSSGKSTFCEIISLILFGKTPRCSNSYSFIRCNETEANCSIKLISNGIEYEVTRFFKYHSKNKDEIKTYNILQIKKYIKKNKYNIYVKSSCKKILELDNMTNVFEKEDKFLINMINTEIITYEEIYQLLVISQNRELGFLQEKDKDVMLFKISNLSYLNNIATTCSKKYSELRKNIKDSTVI